MLRTAPLRRGCAFAAAVKEQRAEGRNRRNTIRRIDRKEKHLLYFNKPLKKISTLSVFSAQRAAGGVNAAGRRKGEWTSEGDQKRPGGLSMGDGDGSP